MYICVCVYTYIRMYIRIYIHAYSYTPTLTRPILHAYSYTPIQGVCRADTCRCLMVAAAAETEESRELGVSLYECGPACRCHYLYFCTSKASTFVPHFVPQCVYVHTNTVYTHTHTNKQTAYSYTPTLTRLLLHAYRCSHIRCSNRVLQQQRPPPRSVMGVSRSEGGGQGGAGGGFEVFATPHKGGWGLRACRELRAGTLNAAYFKALFRLIRGCALVANCGQVPYTAYLRIYATLPI
jgi:hypothetical protein